MKKLLILGTATDGPVRTPVQVHSLREAQRIFGGIVYETYVLSPDTERVWLTYPAQAGTVQCWRPESGRLVRFPLYNLRLDPDVPDRVLFDPMGQWLTTGSNAVVVFSYDREPAEGELLRLYEQALLSEADLSEAQLVRISGSVSRHTLQDGEGVDRLRIEGRYPGSWYDFIGIVIAGGNLSLTFPMGMCATDTRTYPLTGTLAELAEAIERDALLGLSGATAVVLEDGPANVLAGGTHYLSEGEDELLPDLDPGSGDTGEYPGTDGGFAHLAETLDSLAGQGSDVLTFRLPFFVARDQMDDPGSLIVLAYDWDRHEFFRHDELYAIDGYNIGGGTVDSTIALPSATDGALAAKTTIDPTMGLYQVLAPEEVVRGDRTLSFRYWVQYGSARDSELRTVRGTGIASDNPIQLFAVGKAIVLIAVYASPGFSARRDLPDYDSQGAAISWADAQAFYSAHLGEFTTRYDLGDFALVLRRFLEAERAQGYLPTLLLPTIPRAYQA